jgi:hypothetical protein
MAIRAGDWFLLGKVSFSKKKQATFLEYLFPFQRF